MSSKLNRPCILIIVLSGIERFAFKGIASNLITYLTDLVHQSTSKAAKSVNSWHGVTWLLPLVGALVADSYGDRYSTIVASSYLYLLGLLSLTSSTLIWGRSVKRKSSSVPFFLSLYLISVGQAGYNPCLQTFGADQLDEDHELASCKVEENSKTKKSAYFQWLYFGTCSGSLLGVTLMPYVQETYGWVIGFAVPTVVMGLSMLCFSSASKLYRHKHFAIKRRPIGDCIDHIKTGGGKVIDKALRLLTRNDRITEFELEEKHMVDESLPNTKFFQTHADSSCWDPSTILRLLPIWASCLMFAVVFQQPATFFTKQGSAMKRNIFNNFTIPSAVLQSSINISILLLLPVYDSALVPVLNKIICSHGGGITHLQRIGIGMIISVVAMVLAALVETKRQWLHTSHITSSSFVMEDVKMSIFWLVPQYVLLGVSDVFTVVGMQEFFYSEVPAKMRTIGIALYSSVFGVGNFVSAILISSIELVIRIGGWRRSWFTDNLDEARLDLYYWLLAVLSGLSFVVFLRVSRSFV